MGILTYYSTVSTLVTFLCLLKGRNVNAAPRLRYPTLGPIKITDYRQKIKLQPVHLSEFKQRVRETGNRYDFLRIFFHRPDLTEDVVDDLIDAGNVETDWFKSPRPNYHVVDPDLQVHGSVHQTMHDTHKQPFVFDGIDAVFDFMDEIEDHPFSECRLPRPEIYRVAWEGDAGKMFYPDCIILHRCRNMSGCCENHGEMCGPKYIQVIRKPFFVLEVLKDDTNFVQPDKNVVQYRMFLNHTECECKRRRPIPGCTERCPQPFLKIRSGVKCKCDCHQDDRRCLNIQTGFESLQSSQLVCIKKGDCKAPKCSTGTFDVRTGFCPMTFGNDFIVPRKLSPPKKKVTRVQYLNAIGQATERHQTYSAKQQSKTKTYITIKPNITLTDKKKNKKQKQQSMTKKTKSSFSTINQS